MAVKNEMERKAANFGEKSMAFAYAHDIAIPDDDFLRPPDIDIFERPTRVLQTMQ